jgi:glycosyltransferase involved in cell wall biosynthesis
MENHNGNRENMIGESIRICFIALGAYPLLSGKHSTYMIGPDVLQTLLAKELAKRGFEVAVITYSDGGSPIELIDGIKVIKTVRENYYGSFLGRVLNQIGLTHSIWSALNEANSDIYFQQGGIFCVLALFCRLKMKHFVVSIGSDAWVGSWDDWFKGKFNGFGFGFLARFLYGLDIWMANAVIVMNEFQKRMLMKNFGKDGVVIKHHVPLSNKETPDKTIPPLVIWVGTMVEVKQPELFLKLAESIPEARFLMIGGYFPSNKRYYDQIEENSSRMHNFQFLGFIPFEETDKYFSRAKILINTSKIEGFPHAFIQAWMNFTPVVSLNADPDEIICEYNMGLHSRTFDQLVKDVRMLLHNDCLRQEMGKNGRRYVEKEHDIEIIINKYIKIFINLGKTDDRSRF